MLLQQIVSQLDEELERLQAIRKVVAELTRSPPLVRNLAPRIEEILVEEPVVRAKTRLGRPRKQRSSATARTEQKPAAPTAFSRPVHEGPVVISLAQLEVEREKRALAQASQMDADSQKEQSVESLTRDISARWMMSPAH